MDIKNTEKHTVVVNDETPIYVGTLDRFGYFMRTIALTEEEVKDTLMKKYRETYKKINGMSASKSMEDNAREEICITAYHLFDHKVEWE